MAWTYVAAPNLTDKQFGQWSKLLEEKVGIRITAHQRQFLQSQVSMRMRELGEDDFTRYFYRVTDSVRGQLEWSILLDRLMVKETTFFRHKPSIDFVCSHLQEKINNQVLEGSYELWSLGCSTGEEAYSLAMNVNESYELARLDPYFGIHATDVSRVAISIARSGHYSARKLEFVPPAFRYKYFTEESTGQFHFNHEIADKICFTCANALHLKEMPKLEFDVVFCQNLLVYFAQSLRHTLLDAIVEKLKPGGMLVIGLGEVINWNNSDVERVTRADVQAYIKHAH